MNYNKLGNEALEKGDYENAVKYYTLALNDDPKSYSTYS